MHPPDGQMMQYFVRTCNITSKYADPWEFITGNCTNSLVIVSGNCTINCTNSQVPCCPHWYLP